MAHFAHVVDGIVMDVKVVANSVLLDEYGVEQEALGRKFLSELHGIPEEQFFQCSYNGNFRNLFPGVGFFYFEHLNAFIPPRPRLSKEVDAWLLDEETLTWLPRWRDDSVSSEM
jgi:hypothetical protein